MTFFKLIYRYLTNSVFRSYMTYTLARIDNQDGINDRVDEVMNEFKNTTLAMLKTRINILSESVDKMKKIPEGAQLVGPLNDLLNELKEDYREVESDN